MPQKERKNMFYKINGSAGTGKTHAMIEKIKELESTNTPYILITPTNKAAMVLNSRLDNAGLNPCARTLHSTIYKWVQGDVKTTSKKRYIDPTTNKFAVDEIGNPLYREEVEYYWNKEITDDIHNKVVLIDESSMVQSDVWYDLLNCEGIIQIFAFGDEKQLPPVEKYDILESHIKPYYRFWHNFDAHKTLTKNHRQAGDLKTFVDIIEQSLFSDRSSAIPVPLSVGNNFTIHASSITEDILKQLIMNSDIVITPYVKVRDIVNTIRRKIQANESGVRYKDYPVVGDKVIFIDSLKIKEGKYRKLLIAKNTTGIIKNIHDTDLFNQMMLIDFEDETGLLHHNVQISITKVTNSQLINGLPRIDYSYAVTAHKSQGGQWKDVLFLDSFWKEDAEKLRYVAVTRATKFLSVVTGITNASEGESANRSILIRLAKLVQQESK
jgi:exodeoxyribonuclease-5